MVPAALFVASRVIVIDEVVLVTAVLRMQSAPFGSGAAVRVCVWIWNPGLGSCLLLVLPDSLFGQQSRYGTPSRIDEPV